MEPAAPAVLGAFVVHDCHRRGLCPAGGEYALRHVPRERLPPTRFAAATYPFSYGEPRPPTFLVVDHPRWMCANPETLDDYWAPDPRGASLDAALRRYWEALAGRPFPRSPDPLDDDLLVGETLEDVLDALALDVPIGERSGGPLLVQSGGWIPRCTRCDREEHVVLQTQAFTGDNTTILVACPGHPEDASIIVLRL
jgi:hypothetical protein